MVLKFNSAGHCLITKQTGIELTQKLKGIKYPQRAKTYDVVEIGHNFKPEEYNTKIITFRDKYGEILQRNVTQKTPNETLETKKNYIKYKDTAIFEPGSYNFLLVAGRKISSVIKKNGKFFAKSEEIQTIPKTNSESRVTISKIESFSTGYPAVEKENQSLYEYSKGYKKGYSLKNYIKNNDSGLFKFGDFEANFENLSNLSADKYLPLHLYSAKQFRRIAPHIIENPEHTPPIVSVKWYNKYPSSDEDNISYGFFNGHVNLNKRTVKSKEQVIQSAAHEKEHGYQREEMRKPIEKHNEETRKYIYATKNYIKAEDNYEEYRKNYKEIKAREAGVKALNDYMDNLNNLRDEFPYAPDYQFGM